MSESMKINAEPSMTELERLRHSCAHVLATAIARIWPETQFAAGPPVEIGFYYDIDLTHRISPKIFRGSKKRCEKLLRKNSLLSEES